MDTWLCGYVAAHFIPCCSWLFGAQGIMLPNNFPDKGIPSSAFQTESATPGNILLHVECPVAAAELASLHLMLAGDQRRSRKSAAMCSLLADSVAVALHIGQFSGPPQRGRLMNEELV